MTGQRDTDRERIRKAVGAVLANSSNYPRGAQPYILGQDIGPLVERTVKAVMAAMKPEQGIVLTPEEAQDARMALRMDAQMIEQGGGAAWLVERKRALAARLEAAE